MKAKHWSEWFLGAGLILLSISHWFPVGIYVLELLGAFAHLTVFLSAGLIIFGLALHMRILAVFALIAALISGTLVLPHFSSLEVQDKQDLSIGQFNLYHDNPTPELAIIELAKNVPDIFSIQEQNPKWSSIIDSIFGDSHPYSVEAPWENCCLGNGLFSKHPITSYEVLDLKNAPTIIAKILVNGREVTVVSLHTRPPAFPNETNDRNWQLEAVAKLVAHDEDACFVIGDFNIVPWDRTFKDFLTTGNLAAIRDGFQATYPMDFGIPLIPIDYITFKGNVVPASCDAITIPGSDHRGLVAGFAFKD